MKNHEDVEPRRKSGSSLGFLTMAFGDHRYMRQAHNLALSLKRHMPEFEICLLTDRTVRTDGFDRIVLMDKAKPAGTILKLEIFRYSPFDRTLFIDSDCLVTRSFYEELSDISKCAMTPVVSRYLVRGEHDVFLQDLNAALDNLQAEKFPKFNGGIYFFDKSNAARKIFSRAKEFTSRAFEFGVKNFDNAGPGDETVIGLALAAERNIQLYDDGGRLMRTPLGITGSLRVDVLGGGTSFVKDGIKVSPAICHFCGDWVRRPEYLVSEYALRHGRRPPALWALAVKGKYTLSQPRMAARTLLRRMGGAVQRRGHAAAGGP